MTIQWNLPTTFFNFMPSYSSAVNPFMNMNSLFSSNFVMPVMSYIPLFNFSSSVLPKVPTFGSLTSFAHKPSFKVTPQKVSVSSSVGTVLKDVKYNAKKGLALAKKAAASAVGFVGKCASYVKKAISNSGLGKCGSGHAYQMADTLRNNKNFKEISPNGVNIKSLPADCVLVYGRGVAGYSEDYGHVEITTGNGTAVSDGVTRNLRRKPTAIFVPV